MKRPFAKIIRGNRHTEQDYCADQVRSHRPEIGFDDRIAQPPDDLPANLSRFGRLVRIWLTNGKKFIAVAYTTGYVSVMIHQTGNFQSFHVRKHSFRSSEVSTWTELSRSNRAFAAAFSLPFRNQASWGPAGSQKKPMIPVKNVMDPSMMNNHCHPCTEGWSILKTPYEISPLNADASTAKVCRIDSRNPISPRE